MGKYLIIDQLEYPVAITEMNRSGDILDLTANRTEDGVLHREVIGTYYNYTLTLAVPNTIPNADEVYERLWWVLTEPVASHMVQLPYQPEPFEGYFGSCKDTILYVKGEDPTNQSYGATYQAKGLSCTLVATRPSRTAGG